MTRGKVIYLAPDLVERRPRSRGGDLAALCWALVWVVVFVVLLCGMGGPQ